MKRRQDQRRDRERTASERRQRKDCILKGIPIESPRGASSKSGFQEKRRRVTEEGGAGRGGGGDQSAVRGSEDRREVSILKDSKSMSD